MSRENVEWVPLSGEDNMWFLRCGRCGARSRHYAATGENQKAAAFQEAFERAHAGCSPTGEPPSR